MASSQNPNSKSIAIIGGGVAGLILAIGLRNHNIPFVIYEAAQSFREIGAGVAFYPLARKAMSMIDPAIEEAFDRCATSNTWESKQDIWLDFRRIGRGLRSVFLDELSKLIPADVKHFGKRLESLVDNREQSVTLKFVDGTEATHAAVIGCDGIKSQVRKEILGHENPAAYPGYSGKYCYRGLLPMDKAVSLLGEEIAQNQNCLLGYGSRVLTFPVAKGKFMNVVLHGPDKPWESDDWIAPATREQIASDFEDWGDTTQKIISLMVNTDKWAMYHHDKPAETYYKGRVCVIGDAAHASTPHQGGGAGMAIEDAFVLSELLARVKDPKRMNGAFRAYDAVRRERTQRMVSTSQECKDLMEFGLPGYGDNIEKIKENLSTRMHWVFNEDLGAEVEQATRLMEGSA